MKKLFITIYLIIASFACGATITPFSDNVDVISGTPIMLDASPYSNSIIGAGPWDVLANPLSSMSSLEIDHYIFLFGSGSLDLVKVYGTPQISGMLTLTANPLTSGQQTFVGTPGALPNEFIFDLNGYNLHQGGTTLISGFDSINTLNFTGIYSDIPEPSGMLLAGMAAMSLLLHRRRN